MQDNNTEGSEGTKPITVKINGAEDQTRDEVRSILAVHAVDKQRMIFEYNGKENSWYLMEGIISTKTDANLVINYQGGQGLRWPLGNDNNSSETPIDKVVSNKTVGDVSSGGGLASAMVETAAREAKKEVISDVRKANKTIVRHKMNVKLSGAWKKTAKSLSKIRNIAKWVGRGLGIFDIASNALNTFKIFSRKSSPKEKYNAIGKLLVSSVSFAFRATPLGFIGSFALSAISNVLFK